MQLTIERAIYGGAGLGHSPEGEATLVPFTLPGELVEVKAPRADKVHEAELLQILEPSHQRIEPKCIHFGVCGGCQYQNATYEAQLQMKSAILRETMERAGIEDLSEIAVHAADPWYYRNRIRLRLAIIDGVLRAGYSRRASNEFLPVSMCPIATPVLWQTAEALLQVAAGGNALAKWLQSATEIELFCTPDETKVQLSFFFDKSDKDKQGSARLTALCTQLQASTPITGAGTFLRKSTHAIPEARWGTDGLLYEVGVAKYWVSRGAFFQINRFLVSEMLQLATQSQTGSLAWDLYAGVGLFSRRLAEQFSSVVAIEVGEPAASDLRAMLGKLGPQHRAVQATTVDFLRNAVLQRERPELIVMDPPRAGLGADVTSLLIRIAVPKLVYVSCDPTTLARDLRVLVDSGYRIEAMYLLDLFPQTFHLETITILHRD